MLTDYSEFEKEIDEAPEPIVLSKGTEVKARIIGVNTGISDKNNAAWFSVRFDVPKIPLAKEFNAFFWDLADKAKLDEKVGIAAFRNFKNFAQAFDIDYSKPFSWEDDLLGKEGWLIVGVRDSEEYGPQNTVSKYLAKK